MRHRLGFLLLGLGLGCGNEGPAGVTGPAGNPYTPTPVLVRLIPATAELGQSGLRVEITGAGTHFTQDSTTVTFDDPGLTAPSVQVNSLGALVAEVSIAPSTQTGPHNVTVTTPKVGAKGAAETAGLTGIFTVGSPLIGVSDGIDALTKPGALFNFSVTNPDVADRPFQGVPALTTGRIVNFSATVGALSGLAVVDALVPAGQMPLSFQFTSGAQHLSYGMAATDPTAPTVTAAQPRMVTLGTSRTGENFAAGANPTNLYQFTTTASNQVAVISVVNTGGGLQGPGLYGVLAPPGGHFNQFFGTSTNFTNQTLTGLAYLPTTGTQYMALFPAQFKGAIGQDYNLLVKTAAGTRFSSDEHGTSDSASVPVANLTLNTPAFSQDGVINYTGDVDYILITTPKAGSLYVFAGVSDLGATSVTYTPQPPLVGIKAADCTANLVPAVPVAFAQQQAAVTAGGTYCATVAHQGSVSAPIPYQLVISQDL